VSNIKNIGAYIEKQNMSYEKILGTVQKLLSENAWELQQDNYADKDKKEKYLSYINKYLEDEKLSIEGMEKQKLADKLYYDVNEYSILTQYLDDNTVEEININAWNDIQIKTVDGESFKAKEHFLSPEQSKDILDRLLRPTGQTIDVSMPSVEAHLNNNIRISAMIAPLVDEDVAVCASIRKLRKKTFKKEKYIESGFATDNQLDFLSFCLNYGVSMLVIGRVNSGKTTFENYLLSTVPDESRIYTIETGARELNLVRTDVNGNILNNVTHTKTFKDITQEKLVAKALRYNPDIICPAEMRDIEAYAAQESSLTGHTVISTLHAGSSQNAHSRIANLCRKVYPIDYQTALIQACDAFPLVVFLNLGKDYVRRIMNISEVIVSGTEVTYNTLFEFQAEDIQVTPEGKTIVKGNHVQINEISDHLRDTMKLYGAPFEQIKKYTAK
jgi:pilus assembly protein CpaF